MQGNRSMLHRLICCAVMLFACGPAWSQWWNPNDEITGHTHSNADYTPDMVGLAQYVIEKALDSGDFRKIERMHDEFLALEQGAKNGRRLMNAFDGAFYEWSGEQKPERLAVVWDEWRAAIPDSTLLPAAEAASWVARAWQARGQGYASTVTPEAWELFHSRLLRAAKVLEAGARMGKRSPVWYEEALQVAGATGEPAAVQDSIFEEGAGKFPLHVPLYTTRLTYLLPKWGGDYDRIDDFIRRAVMRTQSAEGTVLYLILYDTVSHDDPGNAFFQDTKVSWPLLRHSLEDALAHRSDDTTLAMYATYACMARDRETLGSVLAQLNPAVKFGDFGGVSEEACLEWASEEK